MKNLNCKTLNNYFFSFFILHFAFSIFIAPPLFAFTDADIASFQQAISNEPIGKRIALWAEKFIGIPYDPDPLGEYVTRKVIVADDRVDCMYLSFRAVELALGRTPAEAISIALDKRFINKGILKNNEVINYEDRFEYGEDMIDSGKWGREITSELGAVSYVRGSRGRERVGLVSKYILNALLQKENKFRSGDFIFFIKPPEKRIVGEIVGHIGIIKVEDNEVYLIHAGGIKNKGGEVKKVLFRGYVKSMPFAGIRVSRFD